MSYEIRTTGSFERAFKKLPPQIREVVKKQIFRLEDNPRSGEQLRGKFRFLYSLHIKLENTEYRVVYTVKEHEQRIELHYVASRENFYKEVSRLQLKAS
jgi:mRNA-degrading endonuclease RelE of RelBE toxin-antitoxin system